MERNNNFLKYNSPEVVIEYSNSESLSMAECMLFEKFIPDGSAVLDLGVGGGRTTKFLRRIAGRYTGVDYSPAMIAVCRKKFPQGDFLIMDASDLSGLQDCSFDVVVFSFNGIDYFDSDELRRKCLSEVARVLRPGGFFLFSSHHARAIAHWPNFEGARFYQKIWRAARGILHGVCDLAKALRRPVFYKGEGYVLDPVHGGLWTYFSSPSVISRQAVENGFRVAEVAPSGCPRVTNAFLTHWYYYALERVE